MSHYYDFFLKRYKRYDYDIYLRARMILNFCVLTAIFSFVYAINAIFIAFSHAGVTMGMLSFLFMFLAFGVKNEWHLALVSNMYLILSLSAAVFLIYFSGGLYSPVMPWMAFIPLAANLLGSTRLSFVWASVASVIIIYFAFYTEVPADLKVSFNIAFIPSFYAICYVGLVVIILLVARLFKIARKDAYQELHVMNRDLNEKQDEILTQNEELLQQNEEIQSQRESIEEKSNLIKAAHDQLGKAVRKLEKTQKELEVKERENRSVLEAIYKGHFVVEFGPEGNILDVSTPTIKLLGLHKKTLLSMKFQQILQHSENKEEVIKGIFEKQWDNLYRGEPVWMEERLVVNGRETYISEVYVAIRDVEGEVQKILVIANDVTKAKTQQKEISRLNDLLIDKVGEIEQQYVLLKNQKEEIAEINKQLEMQQQQIMMINENLEKRVEERTEDLRQQNIQLTEYAFINSHLLRAPYCSIEGLINLLETDESTASQNAIIDHLKKSTDSLGQVIDKITEAIEIRGHFSREDITTL